MNDEWLNERKQLIKDAEAKMGEHDLAHAYLKEYLYGEMRALLRKFELLPKSEKAEVIDLVRSNL